MKIVKKPWGEEVWLSLTNNYCFKRITIKKGYKTSLQYHKFKEETSYIESGRAMVTHNDKVFEAGAGFNLYLPPGDVHRFEALEDLVLFEASTIHVDDVVRVEDCWGRPDNVE